MTTIYNRIEQMPSLLLKQLVQTGRNPFWAGHPSTDYALATALFLTCEKDNYLIVGSALRSVINQVAKEGFQNTSQQIPPNKYLPNAEFLVADSVWVNSVIETYYLHLRDGFNDY